jgi:hypothetical protein
VKDPQVKTTYTADLSGLVAHTGCTIKVPAAMACVPTAKTNVQPPPTGSGGTGTPNAFGCYKVKCPKAPAPPLELDDQFGSRTVAPSAPKLVCAPAATPPCTQAFDPSVVQVVNLVTHPLDAAGNFDVPSSCGASTPVCCPGGTATSPCGPLNVVLRSVGVFPRAGDPQHFDVSLQTELKTVADIPVTVPLAGDCGMKVATTAGPSPTVQVDFELFFTPDLTRIQSVGTVALSNLTTDDVLLEGSLGCQIANLGLSFFVGVLDDTIAQMLTPSTSLCRLCDSNDVTACGP